MGQTYYDSLVSRSVMMALVVVPLVALTLMVAPSDHEVLAATMAAASAASAFSWNWVAVGLGRPRLIVLYDVLPRAAFIVVAIAIILNGHALAWYPACLIASTAVSLALSVKRVVPPSRARRTHRQILARSLRHQLPSVATTTSAGAYTAASIFIVGLATTTQATAMTSSADRLYRIGLLAVVALSSAFQAWVVHDDEEVARRRRLVALRSHTALAVVGGSALAILTPAVSRALFGASLSPSWRVTAWYGIAFAGVAVSTSLSCTSSCRRGGGHTCWHAPSPGLSSASQQYSGWPAPMAPRAPRRVSGSARFWSSAWPLSSPSLPSERDGPPAFARSTRSAGNAISHGMATSRTTHSDGPARLDESRLPRRARAIKRPWQSHSAPVPKIDRISFLNAMGSRLMLSR